MIRSFYMTLFRTLFVIVVAFASFPAYAQDDVEIFPDCFSYSGLLHPGVRGTPYWVKNNELKAPAGEEGDLFIFRADCSCRIAIYCYTEDKKSKTPKPIPVRADIDVEKRYVSARQGGGLMGSMQIDDACTVSLFIPHAVYALEPGEYVVRFKVVGFYTDQGKPITEEYWIDQDIPIEVQKTTKRGGKSGTRIVNQLLFDATDDGLPPYINYRLLPVVNR